MCRDVLLQNASGKYCFGSHWRAREAEILVLAARGYEKKLGARRAEVLADTTLCKGQFSDQWASEHVAVQSSKLLDSASEHVVDPRLCQIEMLRMFRQKTKRLWRNREICPRVCLERPLDLI